MAKRAAKPNQWADVDGRSAFIIPMTLLRHPNLKRLSPNGCKLIFDLARQYFGNNNGYLSAAFSIMEPVGWRSEATLREAIAECLHYGLIIKSRQGGRNRCNLFALTWWRIHEKPGQRLDVRPTIAPDHDLWKQEAPDFQRPTRKKSLPPQRASPTPAADGVISFRPRVGGSSS